MCLLTQVRLYRDVCVFGGNDSFRNTWALNTAFMFDDAHIQPRGNGFWKTHSTLHSRTPFHSMCLFKYHVIRNIYIVHTCMALIYWRTIYVQKNCHRRKVKCRTLALFDTLTNCVSRQPIRHPSNNTNDSYVGISDVVMYRHLSSIKKL